MTRYSASNRPRACHPQMTHLRLGVLSAALMWSAGSAMAATISWNAGIGDWFETGNWDPAQVPVAADTVSINNGGTTTSAAATTAQANTLSIGSGVAATQSGTAMLGGGLQVGRVFVGIANSGDGSTATGTLSVGQGMTGLTSVGVVNNINDPNSAASTAVGSVTVTSGDATVGFQGLVVGRGFFGGSSAEGSVDVQDGTLRTEASFSGPQFWTIGTVTQATATGSVKAVSVDTSTEAIGSLFVGTATGGGAASGSLELGSGDVNVEGNVQVGFSNMDFGASANGTALLGGTLAAQGTNRQLLVGVASGGGIFSAEETSASGLLKAEGVAGFRNVSLGMAVGYAADETSAAATVNVGVGGIQNTNDPGGSLRIGFSEAISVNGSFAGPATVSSQVGSAGDISGYSIVDVGRVESTGIAAGKLALTDGTLATSFMRIGTVEGGAGVAAANGVTNAKGSVSVMDGAIAIAPSGNSPGLVQIGAMTNLDTTIVNSAEGKLELTRSSLTGGSVFIGSGGGQGSVIATDNSTIDVNNLSVGSQGGSGSLSLADGTLKVSEFEDSGFFGTMSVAAGGVGEVDVTRSVVTIAGNLAIATLPSFDPNEGRMALTDSTMDVGGSVGVGNFGEDSRAELVLVNSEVTVGGDLRLGASANNGTLFGDALLSVDASLVDITGDFIVDIGARSYFGIAGLNCGLGGYGAINTAFASLTGLITIDFAKLGPAPGFGSAVFDLIFSSRSIANDFEFVELLNLPGGYVASYGIQVADAGGDAEVWRVSLIQEVADVPEPGTLGLLLSALIGLSLIRRAAVVVRSR